MRGYLRRNIDLVAFLVALGAIGLGLYVLPEATFRDTASAVFKATLISTIVALVVLVATLPVFLVGLARTLRKGGRLLVIGLVVVLVLAFVIRFFGVEPFTPRYRNGLLFSPLKIMWHFDLFTSNRPSGHAVLVGLLYRGDSVTIYDAFTVNRVLGALLVLPVFSLLAGLTRRPSVGFVGALLVAIDPLLVDLSRGAEQIVPGLFFATLALALLTESESPQRRGRVLFIGAVTSLFLATTMRNELILLPILFVVVMSFQGRRDWSRRGGLAVVGLLLTLVMAFQVAQFRFTGEWHLVLNDPAHTTATLLGFLSGARTDFEVLSLFRGFAVYISDPFALGALLACLPALLLARRMRWVGLSLMGTFVFVWFVYTAMRPGGIVRHDAALPALHLVLLLAVAAALMTGLGDAVPRRSRLVAAALTLVLAVSGFFYVLAYGDLGRPGSEESAESCSSVASCHYFAARFTRSFAEQIEDDCFIFTDERSVFRIYAPMGFGKIRRLRDIPAMLAAAMCGFVYRDFVDPVETSWDGVRPLALTEVTALCADACSITPVHTQVMNGQVVGFYRIVVTDDH